MAHLLGAEALHLEFPTKVVFDGVSLGVDEGDRIGIVGRNGDGKSSLLAMLAGRLEPDSGRVTVRGGVTVGVLDQGDVLDDDDTVGHAVVGDAAEHEWAGDARVRDVIAGLVADLPWDAALGTLSGGQRRRVALARLPRGEPEHPGQGQRRRGLARGGGTQQADDGRVSGRLRGHLAGRLLAAQEQAVEFGHGQLDPGGTAVVALVGALGLLHLAQQRVHFLDRELAVGAHGAVAR